VGMGGGGGWGGGVGRGEGGRGGGGGGGGGGGVTPVLYNNRQAGVFKPNLNQGCVPSLHLSGRSMRMSDVLMHTMFSCQNGDWNIFGQIGVAPCTAKSHGA